MIKSKVVQLAVCIILSAIVFSCEKEIEMKLDESNSYVINSLFSADSIMSFDITESKSVLSNRFDYDTITNAEVIVTKNGSPISLNQQGGKYFSSDVIEAGATYAIEAKISGLTLSAETKIPSKVQNLSIDTSSAIIGDYGFREKKIRITFDDGEGKSYYKVSLVQKSISYYTDYNGIETSSENEYNEYFTVDGSRLDLINSTDDFGTVFGDDFYYNELYFSDLGFENQTINLVISFPIYSYEYSYEDKFYSVIVSKVSEDYLLYNQTKNQQQYTSGDPFAQPTLVYSNINNGLGIFAGISSEFVTF